MFFLFIFSQSLSGFFIFLDYLFLVVFLVCYFFCYFFAVTDCLLYLCRLSVSAFSFSLLFFLVFFSESLIAFFIFLDYLFLVVFLVCYFFCYFFAVTDCLLYFCRLSFSGCCFSLLFFLVFFRSV